MGAIKMAKINIFILKSVCIINCAAPQKGEQFAMKYQNLLKSQKYGNILIKFTKMSNLQCSGKGRARRQE